VRPVTDIGADVMYRVWCEREECNFEREGGARNAQLAQKKANGYIVGHGLDTGHHETYREVKSATEQPRSDEEK
jgi:hypothetical protein